MDQRGERLQDCTVREEMVLAFSKVPKFLKYLSGLWKLGGAGNEPQNTNTFKTSRSVCAPEAPAQGVGSLPDRLQKGSGLVLGIPHSVPGYIL